MVSTSFTCVLIIAATLSVVTGEDCGYVRRPLATINDTVVINLDCKQTTPSSHYAPLQLRDNTTHVAVQLVHCHTVPVGLFTNVTDRLTSVTVVSEDAVHLLRGTFEGLGHLTELRLLGFSSLTNMSVSLFEPLRNIETLILDGFGRSNIKLFHLGSAIQKLTNTPIKRLVLNNIRAYTSSKLLEDRTMRADDFKILNASVKELIVSNTPMHSEGSIRRAFPYLTCFFGSRRKVPVVQTARSFAVMWDLIVLSNTLKEFIFQYDKSNPGQLNMTLRQMLPVFLSTLKYYPDLLSLYLNRPAAKNCAIGIKLVLGANVSRITLHRVRFIEYLQKPICVEQNNTLEYLDFTGTLFPSHFAGFRGFNMLKYLSLANTGIKSLPNDFLYYFPALEILKLSQLDIGEFISSIDGNFFAFNPTLAEIHLDNCQLTDISSTLISALINFQRFGVTNMSSSPYNVDSNFRNPSNVKLLNFGSNNIRGVSRNSIAHLNELALGRPERSRLYVDLTYNDLLCLCNSTHFIEWLQRLPADSNIEFLGFSSYRCLYPNGSNVSVSEVVISELEEQCRVIRKLVNGSKCPCDEDLRRRLQQIRVYLDGYFCRNDAGEFVPMKSSLLPSCFNPYSRASFIAPVVVGGILGITLLITVGLLIYYRNSRRVQQVRECLEMNPIHFVRTALQYVRFHNRAEEHAMFQYDMIVFVHPDDRSSIHSHFIEALHEKKRFITGDDFRPGELIVDAMEESIRVCQWTVPVLTSNFLSDPVCVDFISRVQFSRPHALIPIVWEQPLDVTDVSIEDLLRTGEPLHWPGDLAADEDKCKFWSSLFERTIPLR